MYMTILFLHIKSNPALTRFPFITRLVVIHGQSDDKAVLHSHRHLHNSAIPLFALCPAYHLQPYLDNDSWEFYLKWMRKNCFSGQWADKQLLTAKADVFLGRAI